MKKRVIFTFLIVALGSSPIFAVLAQRLSLQELNQKRQQFQRAVQRRYALAQRCWRGECNAKDRKELKRLAKWISITAAALGIAAGGTLFARSKIHAEHEKAFWDAMEQAGSPDNEVARQAVAEIRVLIESGKINVENRWEEPINPIGPKFKGIGRTGDDMKDSPLWVAAEIGNRELVRLLLANGAHPDIGRTYEHLMWTIGAAPLLAASGGEHYDVFVELIEAGAEVCLPFESVPRSVGFPGRFGERLKAERTEKGCETLETLTTKIENYYKDYGYRPSQRK